MQVQKQHVERDRFTALPGKQLHEIVTTYVTIIAAAYRLLNWG
jgi:hypothetical protein